MAEPIKQKSIALGDVEITVVDEFAEEHGVNFSKAVRSIIRRYAGLEDDRFRLTPKGKKVLEDAQKE
jgi:hypothetical protein